MPIIAAVIAIVVVIVIIVVVLAVVVLAPVAQLTARVRVTPSTVAQGSPATLSVEVENHRGSSVTVSTIEFTIRTSGGGFVAGWSDTPDVILVPSGQTATVWSSGGPMTFATGSYEVTAVVHTNGGNLTGTAGFVVV